MFKSEMADGKSSWELKKIFCPCPYTMARLNMYGYQIPTGIVRLSMDIAHRIGLDSEALEKKILQIPVDELFLVEALYNEAYLNVGLFSTALTQGYNLS